MNELQIVTAYENLSDQHKVFVNSWLLCFDVNKMAKKFQVDRRTIHNWLNHAGVRGAIAERQEEIKQKCDVTIEECLNELAKIAFFDHKHYARNFTLSPETGEIGIQLEDWDEIDTSPIQEISCKINAQGIPYLTVKPYNKVDALKELLNRLQGTNGDRHLHFHTTAEEMAKLSSQQTSNNYQQMVQNAMR